MSTPSSLISAATRRRTVRRLRPSVAGDLLVLDPVGELGQQQPAQVRRPIWPATGSTRVAAPTARRSRPGSCRRWPAGGSPAARPAHPERLGQHRVGGADDEHPGGHARHHPDLLADLRAGAQRLGGLGQRSRRIDRPRPAARRGPRCRRPPPSPTRWGSATGRGAGSTGRPASPLIQRLIRDGTSPSPETSPSIVSPSAATSGLPASARTGIASATGRCRDSPGTARRPAPPGRRGSPRAGSETCEHARRPRGRCRAGSRGRAARGSCGGCDQQAGGDLLRRSGRSRAVPE